MKLVYRGIKYSSHNSKALKIVTQDKHKVSRLINNKKLSKSTTNSKFPLYLYFKQLFVEDSVFVKQPHIFWKKNLTKYLEKCWRNSEIKILDACWKMTLEQEQKTIAHALPKKLKYRGVTYYK